MTEMKRIHFAVTGCLALALALPAAAPATLSEVGVIGATSPATAPSCPASPCLAVSRTTGFQVKVGEGAQPAQRAPQRLGRRLDDHARQAQRDADQVLQRQRGRRLGSRHRGAARAEDPQPDLQADRPEPARQTAALLRQDGPVPARHDDPGQKGRHRRADRALVGAGAGARLRQRHLLAREPPAQAVHDARARRPITPRSAARCSTSACTRPRA